MVVYLILAISLLLLKSHFFPKINSKTNSIINISLFILCFVINYFTYQQRVSILDSNSLTINGIIVKKEVFKSHQTVSSAFSYNGNSFISEFEVDRKLFKKIKLGDSTRIKFNPSYPKINETLSLK